MLCESLNNDEKDNYFVTAIGTVNGSAVVQERRIVVSRTSGSMKYSV